MDTENEIWELVDEEGRATGVLYDRSSGAPISEGLYFKVVEVWARYGERILVTQRHPDKWSGLLWEVSGGGVLAGEENRVAAARELAEEVGIFVHAEELSLIGVTEHAPAMVYSYFLKLENEPALSLQESEVVAAKLVSRSELEEMIDSFTEGTRIRYSHLSDKLWQ